MSILITLLMINIYIIYNAKKNTGLYNTEFFILINIFQLCLKSIMMKNYLSFRRIEDK